MKSAYISISILKNVFDNLTRNVKGNDVIHWCDGEYQIAKIRLVEIPEIPFFVGLGPSIGFFVESQREKFTLTFQIDPPNQNNKDWRVQLCDGLSGDEAFLFRHIKAVSIIMEMIQKEGASSPLTRPLESFGKSILLSKCRNALIKNGMKNLKDVIRYHQVNEPHGKEISALVGIRFVGNKGFSQIAEILHSHDLSFNLDLAQYFPEE